MTALGEYFRQRGVATCGVAPGITTPAHFSSADTEHLATRRTCGLFDFSFMACVEIRGVQSLDFLHRLQTRNLARLAHGHIAYTLMLRADGTVLNDATVWRFAEGYFALFMGRRSDLAHVRAVSRGFDVTLTERSDDHAVLAVQGPNAWQTLTRCIGDAPRDLPYFGFWPASFQGAPCWIARIGYSGETGYEIILGAAHAPALWRALHAAGATECGFEAINSLRIEAGHVLFSAELARPVTPAILGLSRLVDTYVIDFIGNINSHKQPFLERYRGLLIDRMPAGADAGALIGVFQGARITSACRSPILQRTIALGFVAAEHAAPGTRLRLAASLTATVARLPFYDPAKHLARRTR